jgi:hypothetical protein
VPNPVIARSLESIRNNPWGVALAIGSWLLVETTKDRLFVWINSQIDRESGTVIRSLRFVLSWTIGHPVEFGLVVAAVYCIAVITHAQMAVAPGNGRRPGLLGELGFVYPGEALGQRWSPSIPGAAPTSFSRLADAPVPNSVSINGQWDPGIDCDVEAYLSLGRRLTYAARFSGHTAVYTYVRVLGPDGSRHERWLQHVLGGDDERVADANLEHERKIYVTGRPLSEGWLSFDLSLPDEVLRAYAQEGFVYSALLRIRLRGALSISPIQVHRDHAV